MARRLGSLVVASIALRRTILLEIPYGWLNLEKIAGSEWFLATLDIKNPSRVDIRLEQLTVSLPDFRLGQLSDAYIDDGAGNRVLSNPLTVKDHYIAMSWPGGKHRLSAGDSLTVKFLIFKPSHSRKRKVQITAFYYNLVSKPKGRRIKVVAQTRLDF